VERGCATSSPVSSQMGDRGRALDGQATMPPLIVHGSRAMLLPAEVCGSSLILVRNSGLFHMRSNRVDKSSSTLSRVSIYSATFRANVHRSS